MLRLQMCGGLEVVVDDRPVADAAVGGRQGRLVLAYLTCERHRPVLRDELVDLLWPGDLPDSWSSSLPAVVSRLRRLFTEAGLDGATVLVSTAGSYQLVLPSDALVDTEELAASVDGAERAVASGDAGLALERAAAAEAIASRGFLPDDCEWVDRQRAIVRALGVRAALARSAAHGLEGAHHRAVEAARDALAADDTHEASHRQLMQALAAAGERAEALRVFERCRVTLEEELGVDPSPETEALHLEILGGEERPDRAPVGLPSGVVTFLLTDIVESTAMWDRHPEEMAAALERHDQLVAEVVAAHGGTLLKSKLEGDATVSVFSRATGCATAALALLDALDAEDWPSDTAPRLRMAMHTGEAFERGGDYFGPALNRAARLRSLAGADQVLLSQAVTELVRDHLPADVVLEDLGHRDLRGLSRGENVFLLARASGTPVPAAEPEDDAGPPALVIPPLPGPLTSAGPFVGRSDELRQLRSLWLEAAAGRGQAVFVGGEPGVGKSRLAAELAREAHPSGAVVLYGRCDEDLAAPLQPFVEALGALGPALGSDRVRAVRGVEELARVVPELGDLLAADTPSRRADPDSERLALFDAATQLLVAAAREAPVLLVIDDLHWAGKTTLSLLRHVLRGATTTRLLVVGTYRDTELGRSHPLAATLADLRRDGFADRLSLSGLERTEVAEYLAAVGRENHALGRELAEVTSGNPFFLIEVVRHIEETGGAWEPGSLPEGVREATGRRLSLLSERTNEALSVAAVVGASFDLALVEQIRAAELTDEIDEACRAGLVVEEHGAPGRFRFAHALVRQVLLAELVTLKRVRLHRAIAELLEAATGERDLDARLADLAYHWYECAAAGDAAKAVDACRRAADRAVERLAYEEAGDLYGMALQALDDGEQPDPDVAAALHLARCDALLTAGDVTGARTAIDALEHHAHGSERLAAWYTTYEGLLAVLGEPDRLTEIVQSIGAAASAMRAVGDLGGEAKAHYVHASALERLGQIGAAERALDAALAAARAAGDRRLADAILAEAPPAALWGPRPVTRASGTCLDVVRVLRVTQGAPAVEAVALRCQAVLEALRGRMDAARRMIASARRTFDRLGLAHRQLEVEVAAGFIELLDGQAEAAESALRAAYDELRSRGLDGEAAQAGAFLGRALLMQGRVEEADEVALVAAELAGSDLKAGIAWRNLRAEAAVRRGDIDLARTLAEEAVAIASATDALLLVADARLTLATVLDASGDVEAAAAETRRAVEACEAKGATAMLARVRGGRAASRPVDRDTTDGGPVAIAPAALTAGGEGRLAMACVTRVYTALNERDFTAYADAHVPGSVVDDRRRVVGVSYREDGVDQIQFVLRRDDVRLAEPELVEARGQRVVLIRSSLQGSDFEVPILGISQIDASGRTTGTVMLEPDDLDGARTVLDEVAARAVEERFDNDAARYMRRWRDAIYAGDLAAARALRTDDCLFTDRRRLMASSHDAAGQDRLDALLVGGGGRYEGEAVATRGRRLVLQRWRVHIPDPASDVDLLVVCRVDEQGRNFRSTGFDPDDLEAAVAELDRLYEGTEAADHPLILEHLLADAAHRRVSIVHLPLLSGEKALLVLRSSGDAEEWVEVVRHDGRTITSAERFAVDDLDEALLRYHEPVAAGGPMTDEATGRGRLAMEVLIGLQETLNRRDYDAWLALKAPGRGIDDRRRLVGVSFETNEPEQMTFVMAGGTQNSRPELIEARGERVALARWGLTGADFEVSLLALVRADAHGRRVEGVLFDEEDLEDARAEMEAMAARAVEEQFDNDASLHMRRWRDAIHAGDPDATKAMRTDDYVYTDRRPLFGSTLDARGKDDTDRLLIGGGGRFDGEAIATRGRSLVLQRWSLHITDPETDADVLVVSRVDAQGRNDLSVGFDPDDVDGAVVELDRLYAAGEAAEHAAILDRLLAHAAERQAVVVHLPLLSAERALLVLAPADCRTEQWVEVVTHDGTRVTGTERFTVDAFDDALLRYGEPRSPAPPAPPIGDRSAGQGRLATVVSVGMRDALNRQDFAAYNAMQAPGRGVDDRRTLVGVSFDGKDTADMPNVMEAGAVLSMPVVVAARGERVTLNRWSLEGSDFEIRMLALLRVDVHGRAVERVMLDEDALDEGYSVLEAMGRRAIEEQFDNDAVHTQALWRRAIAAQDLEDVDSLMAEGFVFEDRRPLVGGSYDDEALALSNRMVFDRALTVEADTVATRGRSLALERWTVRDPGHGTEHKVLILAQVDENGRGTSSTVLDADDLEGALAELDRSYVASEAADHERIARQLVADAAGRQATIVHLPLLSADRALLVLRSSDPESDPWIELVHHDGRVVTDLERFPVAALDDALLRHHGLVAPDGEAPVNMAVRTEQRLQAAFNDHDWDAIADCMGSGNVMDDRRTLVRQSMTRDQALRNNRIIYEGHGRFERETVAIRGERLVLSRWLLTLPDDRAVVPTLTLNVMDEDGRYARSILFDVDDVDAAMAELESLHAEIDGGDDQPSVDERFENEAFRAVLRVAEACRLRDREQLRACFVPKPRYVEHRLGAVTGNLGEPDNLEVVLGLLELDEFWWKRELLATRGERLALVRERTAFVSGDAGLAEVDALSVVEVDGAGLVIGSDTFDVEQLGAAYDELDRRYVEHGGPDLSHDRHADDAREHLDQLTGPPANAAWRAVLRLEDALNARDRGALDAALSPDYIADDRRTARIPMSTGPVAVALNYASGFAVDECRYEHELLDVRGERLALVRAVVHIQDGDTGPAEVDVLQVVEADAAGRVARDIAFEVDALAEATAALDRCHAELEPDRDAPPG